MIARVSTYVFEPERLEQIGAAVRAAVHADERGYDPRVIAAFLGVDRTSGRSVALTVASDEDGLARSRAEPSGAEPTGVNRYDVAETYVANPDSFEAGRTPRLHLSPGTAWQAPEDDPLVYAAFALERRASTETLLAAFAEWPDWSRRSRRRADVYDLEYFMVRHGAPVR